MNGLLLLRVGAWILIALGTAHSGAWLTTTPPANDTERQLLQLMTGYKRDLMGSTRSTFEIVQGFNIAFSIFSWMLGSLALIAAKRWQADLKLFAWFYAAWLVVLTGLSVFYWFIAPTAFLAAALAAFALAGWWLPQGR
jgi:hypothetical protein